MIGATYTARPAIAAKDVFHQLHVGLLPNSAVATLWRFQTRSRASGRRLSELAMYFGCSNGRGPCSISPPSRPGPDGGFYSEVVQLDNSFAPTTGDDTPYAIVIPGFDQIDWTFGPADSAMPDLKFFTADRTTPDFTGQPVWLLSRCGPDGSVSKHAGRARW